MPCTVWYDHNKLIKWTKDYSNTKFIAIEPNSKTITDIGNLWNVNCSNCHNPFNGEKKHIKNRRKIYNLCLSSKYIKLLIIMYINKLLTCAAPNVRGTHRISQLGTEECPQKRYTMYVFLIFTKLMYLWSDQHKSQRKTNVTYTSPIW